MCYSPHPTSHELMPPQQRANVIQPPSRIVTCVRHVKLCNTATHIAHASPLKRRQARTGCLVTVSHNTGCFVTHAYSKGLYAYSHGLCTWTHATPKVPTANCQATSPPLPPAIHPMPRPLPHTRHPPHPSQLPPPPCTHSWHASLHGPHLLWVFTHTSNAPPSPPLFPTIFYGR